MANKFINCTNIVLGLSCGQSMPYFPECINALKKRYHFSKMVNSKWQLLILVIPWFFFQMRLFSFIHLGCMAIYIFSFHSSGYLSDCWTLMIAFVNFFFCFGEYKCRQKQSALFEAAVSRNFGKESSLCTGMFHILCTW